jgi:D-alanine transaminase
MSRTVYVNGEYLPEEDAKISVFDRGFLMADAVYEVSSVLDGKLVDNAAHLTRLQRSLDELRMAAPMPMAEIEAVQQEVVRRNNLKEGSLYLQVSRGVADRDFTLPKDAKPSLVMFTQVRAVAQNPAVARGFKVITIPDIRWKRRDIKTVQLLAPSLAKQQAVDAGADDAWFVEDGLITEGTSNNSWIVKGGKLITRHLSPEILHGITREAILKFAAADGLTFEERAFSVEEAQAADEAFITSATTVVMPVVSIDGKLIGNGNPGSVTLRLRQLYVDAARKA